MPPSGYLLKYFSHHIRITREIFEIYYDRIYHIPSLLIMIPQGGPNDLRLGGIHLLRIVWYSMIYEYVTNGYSTLSVVFRESFGELRPHVPEQIKGSNFKLFFMNCLDSASIFKTPFLFCNFLFAYPINPKYCWQFCFF